MSQATYTQPQFIDVFKHKNDVKTVIEAGSRDLLDALELEQIFPNANIYSFECNPLVMDTINENLQKSQGRVKLIPYAIGSVECEMTFYVLNREGLKDHDIGCASLFKHKTLKMDEHIVKCIRLDTFLRENNINHIDYLCLDLQGAELNALEGLGDMIKFTDYIVVEYDADSYKDAPTSNELENFFSKHKFECVGSICKDKIYKNLCLG